MELTGLSECTPDGHVSIDVEKPCNPDAVPQLIHDVVSAADAFTAGSLNARQELLVKLRTLTSAVETPRETVLRHCWTMTSSIGALAFGVDSGLWKAMVKNGDRPQTVQELANEIEADPVLLARLLRHLGAMGYIDETGPDEYQPTVFSKSLSIPTVGNGLIGLTCTTGAASLKFHEYSRKSGWRNPIDSKDTALMYAYKTDQDMFSWVQTQGYGSHFNDHMVGYHPTPWMSTGRYPIDQRLIEGAETAANAPFWVDIGGCLGQDLRDLKHHYPHVPGQLILQDLPAIINQVKKKHPTFYAMEHDFFTEQPVKGEKRIHPTGVPVQQLRQAQDPVHTTCTPSSMTGPTTYARSFSVTTHAMKQGYSRLLIHEQVVPTTNASWETTAREIMMMTMFCSQERSESDWLKLLEEKAGLNVSKIWKLDLPDECLIECELP